ncbi:RNA polymerase sigma-70 factor [Pseudonocardia sp. GCM10023141]|uniref:RNA polymerase sigma-70 factor n=1 Tax=Pseudonocardia sp. GCM10023141 TaxID=3252653 RepID=UPI003615D5B3
MTTVADFEPQRPRLFGLAYRMLGSAHDAEDVLQDAWLRWSGADRAVIESVPAWLATVVTRLCLTRLTSARARRESYPGPWLPEPVPTDAQELGPLDTAEQRESVSLALLVTLERLTPAERAVYVLREAFGYGHRDIAGVLDLDEAHCRQLYRRARQHIDGHTTAQPPPDRATWLQLVERFLTAANDGDLPALESMLAADVTAWSDGGGKVSAARRPVHGREEVARFVAGVLRLRRTEGLVVTVADVNGAPAVLAWIGAQLIAVTSIEVVDERVATVRFVVNPEKLGYLAARTTPPGGVRATSHS